MRNNYGPIKTLQRWIKKENNQCFKKFKIVGSESNPIRIRDKHGYILCFLSNNVFLMASREAKVVYLGVCVTPKEKTSENFVCLSEAFRLDQIETKNETKIPDQSNISQIHDLIVQGDKEFSQEKPLLHLMMIDTQSSQYIKVTLKLTQTLYLVLKNGEFVTREFISNQKEESLTPEIEDNFIRPHTLDLKDRSPNENITTIELMRRAKDFLGIDFITPFKNGEYLLATSDYMNFAVFKFKGRDSISLLDGSKFNLSSKKLVGLTHVGESEILLLFHDGSTKSIMVKDPHKPSSAKLEDQSGTFENTFMNYLEQDEETNKTMYFKKMVLVGLAALELDFDHYTDSRREELPEELDLDVDYYLQEEDEKNKKEVERKIEEIENLKRDYRDDITKLNQLKKEEEWLKQLKKTEERLSEFKENYKSKSNNFGYRIALNREKEKIQEENELKKTDWDIQYSAFSSREDDFTADNNLTPQQKLEELFLKKYYKELEVYEHFYFIAQQEISSLTSFSFRAPTSIPEVKSLWKKLNHHQLMFISEELKPNDEEENKISLDLKRASEEISMSFKKKPGASQGVSEQINPSHPIQRRNKLKEFYEVGAPWMDYDVVVCASRGYSLRDGRFLLFYSKLRKPNLQGTYSLASKKIRLNLLFKEVEKVIEEMKTVKPKSGIDQEDYDEKEANEGQGGDPEPHGMEESSRKKESREIDENRKKDNEKKKRPFYQAFSDIEDIWVSLHLVQTLLDQRGHEYWEQIYKTYLVANYMDQSSGTIFKRLITFKFKIRASQQDILLYDVFDGIDNSDIIPGSIKVENKLHKTDFISAKHYPVIKDEFDEHDHYYLPTRPLSTIDRLGVLNLFTEKTVQDVFVFKP